MANRAKYPAQSYGIGREYAEVMIQMNGAAAPTVLEGKEFIKSVTHVGGTNTMTVTLFDPFPKMVAHAVDLRDDAASGDYCTVGTILNEGSNAQPALPISFVVTFFQATGAARNNSTLICVITMAFRNSNVTAGN